MIQKVIKIKKNKLDENPKIFRKFFVHKIKKKYCFKSYFKKWLKLSR